MAVAVASVACLVLSQHETVKAGHETGGELAETVGSVTEKPDILRTEAYTGSPFGVGKITFRMGQAGKMRQRTGAIKILERDGRIFYPAFSEGLLSNLFEGRAIGGMQSVSFLFRGNEPLNITIVGDEPESVVVEMTQPLLQRRPLRRIRDRQKRVGTVVDMPVRRNLAMRQWWSQYNQQARRGMTAGDYPELVEAYLTSMLARRLNLQPPISERLKAGRKDELQQTFALMFDIESVRAESIRQLMSEPPGGSIATLPVPRPVQWVRRSTQPVPTEVQVETIARFVPEDCFYLRFGTWKNQLWLKRLMEEYSGDLSRMITLRGYQGSDTNKMLSQLAIETSTIDDLFGGNLIEDVAAIGHDLYVPDGPANAILMLAKNKTLESQIRGRRKKYAKVHADEGVTLTEEMIAGRKVTLLSTPDNRVRSYFLVQDLCHITSSSRKIVERFIEASEGSRSLANNAEFRQARLIMPTGRDDTVFVYLSRAFFENLLSPHYQIELSRRNRSLANIQLLQLAQWAATNEGKPTATIDEMIQQGLLPEKYNQLPDGSSSTWVDDHWQDSNRGRRGFFTPIPDVEVTSITPAESAWLTERVNFYREQLKEVDPMLVAFKRFELSKEVERVVIDARVAPFGKEKYGWMGRLLGPPLEFEVDMGAETLISVQASIAGNMFSRSPDPHQIFGSVQGDVPPKTNLQPTNFQELLELFRTTPGYIGAWPTAGYLDALPALGAQPDINGYTYSRLLDVWRLQDGDFSLISFDRERLEIARRHLKVLPAEGPAQVRLRVGDIANSNLRRWANVLFYEQGWKTSIANVRLLNLMIQQFNLPADTALAQAELLLGVKLACPLEGQYVLAAASLERDAKPQDLIWQSTNWPSFDDPRIPEDYTSPPMEWFRGLSLDVYQRDTQFVVHGHLDIARNPDNFGSGAGGSSLLDKLPSINLFKGFSKVEELPPAKEQLDDTPDAEPGILNPPVDPPIKNGGADDDELQAPSNSKNSDR